MWGSHANVHFKYEEVRRRLYKAIPTVFLDLIDIATYVYTADQAVPRGGGGLKNMADIGGGWRRHLFFRIPTRNPDIWKSPAVHDRLVSTLSFLSEDEYRFEFEGMKKDTLQDGYFDFEGTPYDNLVEDIVLFSGGLDSLAGAVQESVLDKRTVLLVNHRSTEKLTPRHQHLLSLLNDHAKDHRPLHLPVRINKAKELGREYTQRTRSFVYAALGSAVATMLGLNRIRFYENGVVSLNLPPSAQVVGARATRTTHPRVLNGFAALLSSLAGKPFAVENPFLWKTKAEVVKLIGDAGCANLIPFSTSCTHTWESTKQHTHCGMCSQCIDRRFAVLAAGREANDPCEAYKVDLLVGARKETDSKTMLAAYVETATDINVMSNWEFFSRYGEASRVVKELGGNADETGQKIFELYKLHAEQVTGVVDRAIVTYAQAIRKRTLPSTCLLRLVCDSTVHTVEDGPSTPPEPPEQPSLPEHLFRRSGQVWEVRFANGRVNLLLPSKGAAYLHTLLSQPGKPARVVAMAYQVARCPAEYALGDAGERIDPEALTAYQARYDELKEEMATAKANNDLAAQSRINGEMSALQAEIKSATAPGGKLRKDSDDRERVRKAVGNAIRRAVRDIAVFDSPLGKHFQPPQLICGISPCYRPNPEITWET
jgi:hypothetical protein